MGENLEGLVKFIYGTQAQYDAIDSANYDEDALYFLTDTNKLYKGSTLIANYVNERVIAAALVDLNNTATTLSTKITKNSSDIRDVSSRLSEIGEVIQQEIQPLVNQVTDISANVNELDEVFAAVANDLNSRINTNTANLLNVSTSIETIYDDITEISDNLYDVSTEVFGLDIALAAAANDLNDRIIENSENILNVSANIEELDYILASVGTQLDTRITDVSMICQENYNQLSWVVINN